MYTTKTGDRKLAFLGLLVLSGLLATPATAGTAVFVAQQACKLVIDSENLGELSAGQVKKIDLSEGEHYVQAMVGDREVWEKVVTVPATGQVVVKVEFAGAAPPRTTASRPVAPTTSAAGQKAPGSSQGECTYDFFPLTVGRTWTARTTSVNVFANGTEKADPAFTFTRTTRIVSNDGSEAKSSVVTDPPKPREVWSYDCTPAGPVDVSTGTGPLGEYHYRELVIPARIKVGTEWETEAWNTVTRYVVTGVEDVVVEAGAFKAVRVESSSSGIWGPGEGIFWYTKGVGLVKSIVSSDSSSSYTINLNKSYELCENNGLLPEAIESCKQERKDELDSLFFVKSVSRSELVKFN